VRAENAGRIVGTVVWRRRRPGGRGARCGRRGYRVPVHREPDSSRSDSCNADFVHARREGHPVETAPPRQVWRRYNCVLLTAMASRPDGVRPPRAAPSRGVKYPGLRPRGQRPLGLLHLLGRQAGIDNSHRERAEGHSQGQVHRSPARTPTATGSPATWAFKLNGPGHRRARSVKYGGCRRSPGRTRSSGISAGLNTSSDALANQDFRLPDQDLPAAEATRGRLLD